MAGGRGLGIVVAAVVLGVTFPASALAGSPPGTETFAEQPTSATTATVPGYVNPEGETTTYDVEYDLASTTWCTSNGVSGTAAHATTSRTLDYSDSSFHAVSADLTGLSAGVGYCAEVSASNASGPSPGGDQISFVAGAPTVETYGESIASATEVDLYGTVDPGGQATTYDAEYDTASSTWCTHLGASGTPAHTTTPQTLPSPTAGSDGVDADITQLTPGTRYCAAIAASNASGTGAGPQVTFTAGAPSAATDSVNATGLTTATVAGYVTGYGQTTTYDVEYDLASSAWCMGASGSPAHTTTPQQLASDGAVTVTFGGLSAGTAYCVELVATNASGTTAGAALDLTAGAPSVDDLGAAATGASTATVSGDVDPAGQTTLYHVAYGLESSTWCETFGASGSPSTTSPQTLAFSDGAFHDVSVPLSSLVGGDSYCAELIASNGTDAAAEDDLVTFTVGPSVSAWGGSATGATTATVSGTVNPGGETTTYDVAYGPSSSTWCTSAGASGTPAATTAVQTLGYTDGSDHQVSVDVTNLTAGTPYCAELLATNAATTVHSQQVSFTPGLPSVATFGAPTPTGASTATLSGYVGSGGLATTYVVEYDLASSSWCTSNGASGAPAHTTPAQQLAVTDDSSYPVSVTFGGLTAGTSYCAELVATNAAASANGGQSQFTAGAPAAGTDGATVTGATTASVSGDVSPSGQTTTYDAEYDLDTSTWCSSHGASGQPAHTTTAQTLAFADDNDYDVSVDLANLSAGSQYCVELVAANASASARGSQLEFTAGTPAVTTTTVTVTGAGTATVTGAVNPSNQTTTYDVEYDAIGASWCGAPFGSGEPPTSTTATPLGFIDAADHDVTVNVAGLTPGTTYCAALVASNASGTGAGSSEAFTAGAPSAVSTSVTPTGSASETLSGSVSPGGQATTYYVAYDLATSAWCEGQDSATPAYTTAVQSLAQTDATAHDVSVALNALTPGTAYCAQLIATNASGLSPDWEGAYVPPPSPLQFTAGVPAATTNSVTATGATMATLDATINPAGQATTYDVEWDLDSSLWCQTGGASGTPANSTTSLTLGVTDDAPHDVAVNLSGLSGGELYCAELVAENGSGAGGDSSTTPFSAGQPSATTVAAATAGATSETVSGAIDPAGEATTYTVEYDLATSDWCASDGSSGGATNATPPQTLAFSDGAEHDVSVTIDALTTGSAYCAALVATNASGNTQQVATPLDFVAGALSATTQSATSDGPSTATIGGAINPADQSSSYYVAYDLATSAWCAGDSGSTPSFTTPTESLGSADYSAHAVSVAVNALTPGVAYCAEIVATSGPDSTLEPAGQIDFVAGAPEATTESVSATGATTATLDATVNPSAQTTTYSVEYALESSAWCISNGSSGSPAGTSTPQQLAFSDDSDHAATIDLSGLSAGTDYCAEVIATNASASSDGGQLAFATTAAGSIAAGGGGGNSSGNGSSAGGASGGGGSPAPPTQTSTAQVASVGQAHVKGTTVGTTVTCGNSSTGSCVVTVTMTVSETVKGVRMPAAKRKKTTKRTVVVGVATATVAAGAHAVVQVTLNAAGRRLLATQHRLTVKLAATDDGRTLSTQTVTFSTRAATKRS